MGFGLIKPTEIVGDIVIYSKWCVQCRMPDELLAVNTYALHKDLSVQVIRTAYRPADHKKATELWGCRTEVKPEDAENYPTFVIASGSSKIKTLKEYAKMVIKAENKMIKEARTKNDVQGLPKAKRVSRKDSVADTAAENQADN